MKPKIGLALGAGSARGVAHLGVLEAFEEAKIEIDLLAGTSIGSIIAGFYAAGIDLAMTKKLAINFTWDQLNDYTVPKKGLMSGEKVKEFIELLTKDKTFSELEIPFSVVATDIERGEEVIINQGKVAEALRASMSIPGIYVPYELEGRTLVDGAVLNRVPVQVVEKMGADIVVGVNVTQNLVNENVKNIFDVILNSIDIMQQEITNHKNIGADLEINPDVENIDSRSLEQAEECIELGYQAAKKQMPKLEKIIKRWQDEKS